MSLDFHRLLADRAPLPLNLQIETTTRCNLRCVMCPKGANGEVMADLDLSVLERLGDLIAGAWEVRPHGFGEAFLGKGLETVLRRCAGSGAWTAIVSNGTLINERRARMLVDVGVQHLIVSIDAADPDLFYSMRATPLEKIVTNIRGLQAEKIAQGRKDPHVTLQMVGMSNNIHDLPAMVELASSVGADAVSLVAFTEYVLDAVHELGLKSLLADDEIERARAYVKTASELGSRLGVRLELASAYQELLPADPAAPVQAPQAEPPEASPSSWRALMHKAARKLKQAPSHVEEKSVEPKALRPSAPRVRCTDPWDLVVINHKGEVNPCCMSQRVMGDLHEESFESIWENETYRSFRHRLLSAEPPEECRGCSKAGWYKPYELEDWVEIGRNDHFGVQIGTGWAQPWDGQRLSRSEAVLRLRNSGKRNLSLTLSLWTDPRMARHQKGAVLVNDAAVGEFEISHDGPHELVFPLPTYDAPELVVKIRCEQPKAQAEGAGRWPGVALSRAALS